MHGSTESQRHNADVQAGQVGAAINPENGDLVIIAGGRPVFGLAPKDAALFVGGLCQLLASHPKLQPAEQPSQLVIAGSVPPFHRH